MQGVTGSSPVPPTRVDWSWSEGKCGMGEWPRGSGRWPVTPEVAGSNPVSPAKSVRMLGVEPGVFFYLNVTFG